MFPTSLCGVLVFDSVSRLLARLRRLRLHPSAHTTLSPTIFHTHHLSPTIFVTIFHTTSFTHNFVTHNFVTHHPSHTALSHTICHTQLCHTPSCHTPSFTHHLCHHLSHTIFHTPSLTHHLVTHHLSHTTLSHTIFVAWSPSFIHNMAPRHFAWQAWHLVTSTFVSRARRGSWRHLPAFGVAGVALGDIHLRFTWQAWDWRTWSPLVARSATPLCHNFITRSLSHTAFTHTIFLCHTTSFIYDFVTHHFFFTCRSSTTSFVFPSFPVPPTTCVDHYWKKLTCGVIRSFHLFFLLLFLFFFKRWFGFFALVFVFF